MEKDIILHGIRLGEYEFVPEKVMDEIDASIARGINYIKFSNKGQKYDKDLLMKWVRHMVENEIYFSFQYYEGRGKSRGSIKEPCGFDHETALEIMEIAGKYCLGTNVGEVATEYCCVGSEYHPNANPADNMKDATERFEAISRKIIEDASVGGAMEVSALEQTFILPYIAKQGASHPCLETLCGNPEMLVPITRGTAKTLNSPFFATYIAHEWYGGVRELDPLKMHRLRMAYDYCYMQGTKQLILESGANCLWAHDTIQKGWEPPHDTPYNYDHPICKQYRDTLDDFAKFLKKDERPVGGPKVSVAFVQGNYDAYTPWRPGSSLWHCFDRKDFGYNTPEFVWRAVEDLGCKRQWHDVHNFGDVDLSGAPAYGTYDIINATAGYEVFSKYDYLIFAGWNTMTEEIYEDLKKYVHGGGRLFMAAAHLNTSTKREGEMKLVHDGNVQDLFGCKLSAENGFCVNDGYKFRESLVPEFMYPADLYFDPMFAEGYVNYAGVELCGAKGTGILSQNFWDSEETCHNQPVWLTENKYGDGYAILMTSLDYPGHCGFTVYKNVIREILTASHRQADIYVYGGDRLRFTVYNNNKVYLLNTDFDCPTAAVIDYRNGVKKTFLLQPRELLAVDE